LTNKNKSLFSENRSEFLELLDYKANVEQQIIYNRKNDYFLLINNYLKQLITPSEFKIEILKMEKQDGRKAKKILQDSQQLSLFFFVESLKEFSNLMQQILDLCFEDGLKYGKGLSKDEFYDLVNNLYLQLKKYFED
jgi:hypothetical protein